MEKRRVKRANKPANLSDSLKVLGRPEGFGYDERSLNIGRWRDTHLSSSFDGRLLFLSAGFLGFSFARGFLVEIDNGLWALAHRSCYFYGMARRARCHPAHGECYRNQVHDLC